MIKRISFIFLVSAYLLFFISIFAYAQLSWKEDLFLFALIGLYIIGCIFKRVTPNMANNFLIFFLIFLLSQFYVNNFHPKNIGWWFASIPGWLTLLIAFAGCMSLLSYQKIGVDSQRVQDSNQTFHDLIDKANPGILVVSLAMFFLFVLNIDEISPQGKLAPDYSIYIIVPFGFVLFYSLNLSRKYLSSRKMHIFLKPATLGILIFLIGIGITKTYIVYAAYHNALHSRSEEKLWQNILELNNVPKIGFIDIKAMNELGKICMEKGNFREAANYYKRILVDQAFNFEANRGLAEIFYRQKDWNRGHEAYKKAISLRPKERSLYSPYIHAFIRDGKTNKASEFIRNLKEIPPIQLEDAEDYLIVGEGLFKEGLSELAIKYLLRAAEFTPHNYEANFLLGKAYLESTQYNDGCEALEKAVRINPKAAEGYYYLGVGYENIHQDHKAIKAFERMVLLDSKNVEGLHHLENLYTRIGLKNNATKIRDLIEKVITKVVEAADWKSRSGENVYQNGNMAWRGTVSAPVILKEGNAKFTLQAMGTPAKGIWPHMVVKLDNAIIGKVDVASEKLKDYEFKEAVKAGKYNLSISFTNDGVTLNEAGKMIEDRNLFIKRCRITYEK